MGRVTDCTSRRDSMRLWRLVQVINCVPGKWADDPTLYQRRRDPTMLVTLLVIPSFFKDSAKHCPSGSFLGPTQAILCDRLKILVKDCHPTVDYVSSGT